MDDTVRSPEGFSFSTRPTRGSPLVFDLLGVSDPERPAPAMDPDRRQRQLVVARCLEELGHEVIVADPNFAPMYATRSKRVKTDRRDARKLAEACRLGAHRRAHRTSEEQRRVRAGLGVREAVVRTRTRYISVVRALLGREGIGVRSGGSSSFVARVKELSLAPWLEAEIAPLLGVMDKLNEEIRAADDRITRRAKEDAVVRRLCTVPGVGVVTAVAFRATLDEAGRFRGAHQVQCYLGLVPREMSSGKSSTAAGSPSDRARTEG